MQKRCARTRSVCACLALLGLLIIPGGALAAWMQVATIGTKTPAAPDGGWPQQYKTPNGEQVTLYQPQIASWDNQKLLTL